MADAAVTLAQPDDVHTIARIQLETWRFAYAGLLGEGTLATLTETDVAFAWRETLHAGSARIFVAREGSWTVGFCAIGFAPEAELAGADGALPADAATVALIGTLLVEPRWTRRGHGGRLLAAAAQAMRADGATRGIVWVPEADTVSRNFYRRANWTPEGTVRTLDADGTALREIRLSGALDLEPHS